MTDAVGMELEDSNVSEVDFQKYFQETISRGSLDFDTWTSVIADIEKYHPDDIKTISLVYDSFLSKFPLCHVYWKKYADHTTCLCTVDKVVEIFERAVQSATYCVGVWVDYCNFGISAFEDPSDIRRLLDRGMSFIGKDYLSYTLWDKYIEFEYSQQQWSFLLKAMIRTLHFPTKKLHKYYDNLNKFAAILEEEMDCQNNGSIDARADLPDAVITSENEILNIIEDLQTASTGSLRSQALQKYLAVGKQFYRKACQLDEKIHCFENAIGRSFFHVEPLDDGQLANWHNYLDFIEQQEDFDWTVKLYERCLIPCVKYPEFWMRYVELMETKGGRELANFALERATQTFLENAPAIHIFNARFRERIGDTYGARAAFCKGNADFDSGFVENVIKAANMEKRLANLAAASSIYEEAFTLAAARQKLHTVPTLYIHFSRLKYLIDGSADAALNIIIDGIQHVPNCRLLLEELIKFVMMHEGSKYINSVDSIIADAIATGQDIHGLSAKDQEDISCLYLEFIDLCGTNHDVRKAWNRHIKLFPHLIRTTYSNEHPTVPNQLLEMAREARKRKPFALPNQPAGHGSSHLIQIPVEEQELLPPGTHYVEPEQVIADQSQLKEDINGLKEGEQQLSLGVLVQFAEDVAEADDSRQDLLHKSADDEHGTNESTPDLVYHSIDASGRLESGHDPIDQSEEGTYGQIESSHDFELVVAPSEFFRELSVSPQTQEIEDNELENHLKPVHTENLSPSYEEKENQNLIPSMIYEYDVCNKISFSEGDILEHGPSTKEIIYTACPKLPPSAASAKSQKELNENDSVNSSPSTSHQSLVQRQTEVQGEVPSDSGEESCQNPITTSSGGTSPNLHEHSNNLTQPDSSAEMGSHIQVQNDSQGGSRYHLESPAQGHVTTSHGGPVQDVRHTSYESVPLSQASLQPVLSHPQAHVSQYTSQTSEQDGQILNEQAYNQMLQYYYQQQQHLLLLQQQKLQVKQPYFQHQQQIYQQQQYNQPQELMYQNQHYLQMSQQLQQPPYQAEQQQYQLYLQHLQQQLQQQQLQPGQQEQFYQMKGNTLQPDQQGYQLSLQQYQLQQQQQYQQLLLQQQLQQQQGYQQLMLPHQLQQQLPMQQQIASVQNQGQNTNSYHQGQGLKQSHNKDGAGPSKPLCSRRSPQGERRRRSPQGGT